MTKRWYEKRVSRIAYELADCSSTGPTSEAREDFEDRLWDAFTRRPAIIDRLERRLGLNAWNRDVVHVADMEAPGLEGIAAAIMGALSQHISARTAARVA